MKKYVIGCLLLLCCISHSQAQGNPARYQTKTDSLQTLIDRQTQDDTLKVKRLNYLARFCFYDLHYQRGLIATVQARQLAQKLHYAKGEALYWRTMVTFNQFEWLREYYDNQANRFYAEHKQREERHQLDLEPASNRHVEKMKAELQAALTYFEHHPDKEIQANVLQRYANIGPSNTYLETVDKAIDLFKKNHQDALAFLSGFTKVRTLERANKTEEAKATEVWLLKMLADTKDRHEAATLNFWMGSLYGWLGRTAISFEYVYKADQLLEQLGEKNLRLVVLRRLGILCHGLALNKKAVEYFKKEIALREETQNDSSPGLIWMYQKVAFTLIELKAFDEARTYIAKAETVPDKNHDILTRLNDKAQHYDAIGQVLMGQGKYKDAIQSFDQALTYANRLKDFSYLGLVDEFYMRYYIAQCQLKLGNVPESIRYGKLSYDQTTQMTGLGDARVVMQKTSLLLSEVYDQAGEPLEAYKYLKVHQQLRSETDQREAANRLLDLEVQSVIEKDEKEKNRLKQAQLLQQQRILAIEKQGEIDRLKAQAQNQSLQVKAEQAELDKKLEKERLEAKAVQNKRQQDYQISLLNLDIDTQRKVRTGLLSGLALFSLFVVGLVRQNRVKQRFNQTLTKQKTEIERQRDQLNQTLTELQTTQAQLIQKEKLASLGELTAGIAHEIQNPLNFVNNFSEISTELIGELNEGPFQKLPDDEKDYAGEILGDISSNLRKIHHHGGRAAAIVRSMLEHSRSDSGERRPININGLTDEYLKIAYHGLRAKDKGDSAGTPERSRFNCELITEFNTDLVRASVVPQEIGRVLLNLYNNAFYAVQQRQHLDQAGYQPTVRVSTKQRSKTVEICVSDNGMGIPEGVKAKIFQPFFTTKPTGEGTGLGLSLSYDIITKGHGGTLTVESVEGEGTTFIVQLPV